MTSTSFYSQSEIKNIGFSKIGKNVLISRNASIYSPEKITLGDNVRIDDFCILSGNIFIGSFIHISAYVAIYGGNTVVINDFSGISPRSSIFSATDDFSGNALIGPMVPKNLTNVKGGTVEIQKYVQIGAGNIVLPDLIIGEGAVTGAMSLINKNLDPWSINFGIPAIKIKERNKENFFNKLKNINSSID